MSYGLHQDAGLENPLAVHIRNFPVSLLVQDKFQECISDWRGVDVGTSSCHQNPNNPTWNGWAIVHFESEQARNNFLVNENQHYVRDSFGDIHKLKVKKWFEKPGGGILNPNLANPVKPNPISHIPITKQQIIYRDPTLEEFEKRTGESSNRSFKGVIQSYLNGNISRNQGGTKSGVSGLLAVTVLHLGRVSEELVLFHSSCVWICTVHSHCRGTADCARASTSADNLPIKLEPDSEVFFTARRIPADIQCSVRYQAKSIWQGEPGLPDFVSPPGRHKLDQYLDAYIDHVDEVNREHKVVQRHKEHEITLQLPQQQQQESVKQQQNKSSSGFVARQKPLTGGLKQLNSDLTKKFVAKVERKQVPTNFAEAVATAKIARQTANNTTDGDDAGAAGIVEKATIESFPARDRVVVSVQGYGRFHLEPSHFAEDNSKDLQSYLSQSSNVLVALTLNKEHGSTSLNKYEVVKAFADNNQETNKQQNITNGSGQNLNEKGLDSSSSANGVNTTSRRRRNESSLEIDLDELDRYYDTQHEISEYLRQKITSLIPDLRASSTFIDSLVNNIFSAEENFDNRNHQQSDVEILSRYLNHPKYNISSSKRQKFIADYLEFRKSLVTTHSLVESTAVQERKLPDDESSNKVVNGNNFTNNHPPHHHDYAANFNLTHVEKEFFNNRQNDIESQSSILRVIIILRKADIQIEVLTKMYKDHVHLHGKAKNKMFNSRLQSYLSTNLSQKMLEEANTILRNSGISETTVRVSCKKLEAYLPSLTTSLCGFIFSQYTLMMNRDLSSETSTMDTISSSGGSGSSSPMRSIPSTGNSSVPEAHHTGKEDEYYTQLDSYLSCIHADDTQLIKTLKQKKLGLSELYEVFESCKQVGEGGKMKWNLEMSKLKLNPAMGITVFRIAEILWNYFHSHPCEKVLDLSPPQQYFAVYDSDDYESLRQDLVFQQFEEDLNEGIEILCFDSSLFTSSDELKEYAGMIGKLWRKCGQDPASLDKDIQNTLNEEIITFQNYFQPLRVALGKWAKQLEQHQVLNTTEINVFNVVKTTLTSYHPNVFEGYNCVEENQLFEETKHNIALFKNIVSGSIVSGEFNLYAAEGLVVGHLLEFAIIQTQFCKVLMHPSVFISDRKFKQPSQSDLLASVINLHSSPVLDSSSGKILFHVARLAWKSPVDRDSGDQPYPGILMPFPTALYENIEEAARRAVEKAEADIDLSTVDQQQELISYGKVWFENLMKGQMKKDKMNHVKECSILVLLIKADIVDASILDSTILPQDLNSCETRTMVPDEFLHTFIPYLETTSQYKQMNESLDCLQASCHNPAEIIHKFLKDYPSMFKHVLLDSLSVESEVEPLKQPGNRMEKDTLITPNQTQENKVAIENIGKRLTDLEQVVRSLLSSRAEGGAVQERSYVRIWAELDGEVEEIPTNKEGLLPLPTIQSIFVGAQGLKYRVSSGGRMMWRNLVLENGIVYPPLEGWGDIIYLARGCGPSISYGSGAANSIPVSINGSNNSYLGSQRSLGSVNLTNSSELDARNCNGQMPHLQQDHSNSGQLSHHPCSSSASVSSSAVIRQQQQQQQRKTPLSQLMVNQTPSSIWGSSPAPILGGISPVSLDFQESSNFGLRDQLN